MAAWLLHGTTVQSVQSNAWCLQLPWHPRTARPLPLLSAVLFAWLATSSVTVPNHTWLVCREGECIWHIITTGVCKFKYSRWYTYCPWYGDGPQAPEAPIWNVHCESTRNQGDDSTLDVSRSMLELMRSKRSWQWWFKQMSMFQCFCSVVLVLNPWIDLNCAR